MLQNVEANNGVHLAVKRRVIFRNGRIQLRDFQMRPVREPVTEVLQMLPVYVGGHISFSSRQQLAGKITHPRSNFEYVSAYIRPDSVRHPAIEIRRAGKG